MVLPYQVIQPGISTTYQFPSKFQNCGPGQLVEEVLAQRPAFTADRWLFCSGRSLSSTWTGRAWLPCCEMAESFITTLLIPWCKCRLLLETVLFFKLWRSGYFCISVTCTSWEVCLHFLGVGEVICTSPWMPVTLGTSHAHCELCRKKLGDSMSSAALLKTPQAIPRLCFPSSWNM